LTCQGAARIIRGKAADKKQLISNPSKRKSAEANQKVIMRRIHGALTGSSSKTRMRAARLSEGAPDDF
jgi:hypothetical protein